MKLDLVPLIVIGLAVGASLAAQTGINATLRTALSTPVQAAFFSFALGTLILAVIAYSQRPFWFSTEALLSLPWWAWLGGVLGAFNIALSVYLAPKLGALMLAGSVVTGQIIAALVFDHFGVAGYPKIDIDGRRVLGAVLMIAGLVLVSWR